MIIILAIGAISLVAGILLGYHEKLAEIFNIDPTALSAFRDFIRSYVAGLPIPDPIT